MIHTAKHILLVHGAWHDGWCWHRLVPELERYGHQVRAPDLPIEGSFGDCVEAVVAELDQCDSPALVVGHSLGGAFITQAAESRPDAVARLVYLAAFLPGDGQSVNALGRENIASALRGHVAPDDEGRMMIDRDVARAAFYADCDDDVVSAAIERLRPMNPSSFGAKLALSESAFGRCALQYIECIEDQAVHVSLQRKMAVEAGCTHINSMRTSHSPFLSAPAELAGLIALSGPPPHGSH